MPLAMRFLKAVLRLTVLVVHHPRHIVSHSLHIIHHVFATAASRLGWRLWCLVCLRRYLARLLLSQACLIRGVGSCSRCRSLVMSVC